ncbi:MAG: hypothetical protein M1826_006598 [Phylliscum demangeonii]|nr:MAG: hypothetical protein M1826_006598 [Phylliscum demangeonii]
MLPPLRLIALALYFSAAYGRPARPSGENNHGDGQPSNDGQLLKDPYNPHGLVSSGIPGRRPRLPYSARPSDFVGDEREWFRTQNIEHIVSQIPTYDGNPISAIDRWSRCMERQTSGRDWDLASYLKELVTWSKMAPFVAAEKQCITKVNQDIQTEAAAKENSTYWAVQDTATQLNPHLLESPNTPYRPPRLPHEQLPAGDQRDLRSYIADENKKDIISKLKQYDGQRPTSWERFIACMQSKADLTSIFDSYLTEQLSPEHMLQMRYHEFSCITAVNSQIDDEAGHRSKEVYLPVRTYAPLVLPPRLPLSQPQQPQQEHTPRNKFSPASIATWAHRAGHFLTTQSHRLGLGARPLQELVQEGHPKLPAWEVNFAH